MEIQCVRCGTVLSTYTQFYCEACENKIDSYESYLDLLEREDKYQALYGPEDIYEYEAPEITDCPDCGEVSYEGMKCQMCKDLDEEEAVSQEFTTKAERREAQRVKKTYGPVRHLEGEYRPKNFIKRQRRDKPLD